MWNESQEDRERRDEEEKGANAKFMRENYPSGGGGCLVMLLALPAALLALARFL